jgi:hypothetical protein
MDPERSLCRAQVTKTSKPCILSPFSGPIEDELEDGFLLCQVRRYLFASHERLRVLHARSPLGHVIDDNTAQLVQKIFPKIVPANIVRSQQMFKKMEVPNALTHVPYTRAHIRASNARMHAATARKQAFICRMRSFSSKPARRLVFEPQRKRPT